MFFAAAEGLGVPHHRVVHVGDLEQTDIKGARSLGMAAIRFDGVRTPEDCKSCTMADAAVPSWPALADLLLTTGEEEALPGGVRL
jgi:FMN phosphatase YigB (HAD superfamily)